ncbi:large conductance mechanosensitive channel protein MscL [Kineococcus glutinatus]|uniref:large conductance mechanosensitive channel protein MscL n=1 Tax=Kineococcus glutinatus TaxID=1070872 RepID=UPI0031E809C0
MIRGFKDFVLRGNVIDLAVAVVIGTAFTAVVTAVVTGLINPLIAAIGGAPSLDSLNRDGFLFGDVLDAVINFLLVAAVVYFLIVTPMNRLFLRLNAGREEEPKAVPADVQLLTEIRDLLRERSDRG